MMNVPKGSGEAVFMGWGNMAPVIYSRLLPPRIKPYIYDPRLLNNPEAQSLVPEGAVILDDHTDKTDADIYVMAVPYPYPHELLGTLARDVDEASVILDVSSVQLVPTEEYKAKGILGRPNFLATHPLFGPKTARRPDMKNKTIAIIEDGYEDGGRGDGAQRLLDYWERKGPQSFKITAREHDKHMAMHALALFIGDVLVSSQIKFDTDAQTPSTRAMANFMRSTIGNSPKLYDLIQTYNPYAFRARTEFLSRLAMNHASIQLDERVLAVLSQEEGMASLRGGIGELTKVSAAADVARFKYTDQMGRFKATREMPMRDELREADLFREINASLDEFNPDDDIRTLIIGGIQAKIDHAVGRNEEAAGMLLFKDSPKPFDQVIDPRTTSESA